LLLLLLLMLLLLLLLLLLLHSVAYSMWYPPFRLVLYSITFAHLPCWGLRASLEAALSILSLTSLLDTYPLFSVAPTCLKLLTFSLTFTHPSINKK
jgi:hypothetical protein